MNKKFIWIGCGVLAIIIIIVGVVTLNGNAKGPDSIIKKYCDILKNGNYGDIIDIAYFPEGELITKEKLEEKKKQYFEEMRNSNTTNVTKYEYSKVNEDDEKISYKVVLNGTDVKNIDLLKSENKLIIDDLYEERSLKVKVDSKVIVDGVELTNKTAVDDYFDSYNFIAIKGVNYDVKITHTYLKDIDTNLDFESEFDSRYYYEGFGSCKTEIDEQFNKDIEEIFRGIIRYYQQGGDSSTLDKYFVNNNASEFLTEMKDNFYIYGNPRYVDNYKFYTDFYNSKEIKGRPAGISMYYGEGSGKAGISFKDKESNWEEGCLSLSFNNIVFVLEDGKFKIISWDA